MSNDRHPFAIFEKSTSFYWSTNRIFYTVLFSGLAILGVKNEVFHFRKNSIDFALGTILAINLAYGIFSKIAGTGRVMPLHGKLDGFLLFEENCIFIRDEKINLNQIHKITISNNDYREKWCYPRGNFGPNLSNGTNNFTTLYLKSGETKRIQFELQLSNDFQKIRPILIGYYVKEKMDFWDISHVLGETSAEESYLFKLELEKAKAAANTK